MHSIISPSLPKNIPAPKSIDENQKSTSPISNPFPGVRSKFPLCSSDLIRTSSMMLDSSFHKKTMGGSDLQESLSDMHLKTGANSPS
jgi:hypothetical protein